MKAKLVVSAHCRLCYKIPIALWKEIIVWHTEKLEGVYWNNVIFEHAGRDLRIIADL